jgi:hypothetical protein
MNQTLTAPVEPQTSQLQTFLEERLKRLAPVATTRTPSGVIIDWVPRDAQLGGAPIATPPPPPFIEESQRKLLATPELHLAGVEQGPPGTVPFRRPDPSRMDQMLSQTERRKLKVPPPDGLLSREENAKASSRLSGLGPVPAPDYTGHYYGLTGQTVTNYGGSGSLSCFSPAVSSPSHFSLIQIGCTNSQQGYFQTVEAGWIVLPSQYGGDYTPHLFTFFTTDGYGEGGDYLGGWDTFQKGWVQVDAHLHPGSTFAPLSAVDGQQKQITIQYQLRDGAWWFAAQGVWMGYYPASLFAKAPAPGKPVSTVNTLGDHADNIGFWGEVFDPDFNPPSTQMGSGEFAADGFGWSAYLVNLQTQTGSTGTLADYNGGTGGATNNALYTINAYPNNVSAWRSYAFVGGPGAGLSSSGGSIACHAQQGLNQTDALSITTGGGLQVAWVDGGGGWQGPAPIGPAGRFAPNAGLAISPQFGINNQTDVFAVDTGGQLNVAYVDGGAPWAAPIRISTSLFPSGASVAASQQFGLTQTDVFAIDNQGGLRVAWVDSGGPWAGPGLIGATGIFTPGAPVAACQQIGLTQTDVFAIDKQGALRVSWVDGGGAWAGPAPITPNGTFPSGGKLAAGQQIGLTQTDVFAVDNSGALTVTWVDGGGRWNGPARISPIGTFVPGSAVATSQQIGLNQTDVFVVDKTGTLTVAWVVGGGAWAGPAKIGPQGLCLPGAPVSACQQTGLTQTDVFVMDRFGVLNVFWVSGGGAWAGPEHP